MGMGGKMGTALQEVHARVSVRMFVGMRMCECVCALMGLFSCVCVCACSTYMRVRVLLARVRVRLPRRRVGLNDSCRGFRGKCFSILYVRPL